MKIYKNGILINIDSFACIFVGDRRNMRDYSEYPVGLFGCNNEPSKGNWVEIKKFTNRRSAYHWANNFIKNNV